MHEGPTVVVSGGGTGGHLYPALAIADELRALRPDVRVVFVGALRGIESRILPERGEEHLLLPLHGVDRRRPLANLRVVWGLAVGVARVLALFRRARPELVVVTGGYAGAPAGVVAGLTGVPLLLQEQNSLPGMVTRLLTRWSSRVYVAFPEAVERLPAGRDGARLTGNPVRPAASMGRSEARRRYGLAEQGHVVLVVGGSQGSVALNGVMVELARAVASGDLALPSGVRFLWATGRGHHDGVRAELAAVDTEPWLSVLPYFDDMPSALACADLVVSRAGMMTMAELHNEGLPAVLVPLPTSAENHQAYNAEALAAAGAAVVLPQPELDARSLTGAVREILSDPDRLDTMRARARARARPDATAAIAADVATFLPAAGRDA